MMSILAKAFSEKDVNFLHIVDDDLNPEISNSVFETLNYFQNNECFVIKSIYLSALENLDNLDFQHLLIAVFYPRLEIKFSELVHKISKIANKLTPSSIPLIMVHPYLQSEEVCKVSKIFKGSKTKVTLASPFNYNIKDKNSLKAFYIDFIVTLLSVADPVIICVDYADLQTVIKDADLIKVLKIKGVISYEGIFKYLNRLQELIKDFDRVYTTFFVTENITLQDLDKGMTAIEKVFTFTDFIAFSTVFTSKFSGLYPQVVMFLTKRYLCS